jgi:hypothetical protein
VHARHASDRREPRKLISRPFLLATAVSAQEPAAAKELQLNTNNHPVAQYRAIGTLQNMPEFHRAFGCKDGDPVVRPTAAREAKIPQEFRRDLGSIFLALASLT